MPIYWEQNVGGFQEDDSVTKVEDVDNVTQKPHMQVNEEEEQMEDPKVNTILIFELQMINKSLSNNYRKEGTAIHKI